MLVSVDYHIIDKCNLKCKGCNHFCPLVPDTNKPKSLEQITADLSLLSKFKDELTTLALLGGEPLLHPKLSTICRIARRLFPNNEITITSNGTLLNRIREIKDALEEYNIKLVISVYPLNKNKPYSHIEMIRDIVPNIEIWDFPTEHGMYTNLLSADRNAASVEEVDKCIKRWRCNQLKDGKLYICHYAAQLNYLKSAFPNVVNIDHQESMYIDLNNDDLTIEDIYKFQKTAYPDICFHCLDAKYEGYDGPTEKWQRSKFELSEWFKS